MPSRRLLGWSPGKNGDRASRRLSKIVAGAPQTALDLKTQPLGWLTLLLCRQFLNRSPMWLRKAHGSRCSRCMCVHASGLKHTIEYDASVSFRVSLGSSLFAIVRTS